MPMEMLTFLRLKDDMQVLELIPGAVAGKQRSWGSCLKKKDKLYMSIGTNSVSAMIADKQGFSTTEVISFHAITQSTMKKRRATVPEFSFGIRTLELVLSFRNVHNFDAVGRANLKAAALEALN